MERVALGFKAHSGWTVMVKIIASNREIAVIDRRRIELIDEGELWAKQPYHAAEELEPKEAGLLVSKGIASARKVAAKRFREIARQSVGRGHEISACGVVVPEPMPDWSTDEILSVHFRMHKAEGVLFPDALCRAAEKNGLPFVAVREKQLDDLAVKALSMSTQEITKMLAALGKSIGPPWSKDQKMATLAAAIAFKAA